jgi:flagellar hook assembly protein FlgD
VRLSIYDVRGTVVRTLLEQLQPAGSHWVQWDGRNDAGHPVASGVYFYEIQAGPLREARKMIRLR